MNRKKTFYHHLISIEEIDIELNKLGLPEHERIELLNIAENTIHHTIIDVVLSELSKEDKKTFLEHHSKSNHETTLRYVKGKITNIEGKIRVAAEDLKKELLKDIRDLKK